MTYKLVERIRIVAPSLQIPMDPIVMFHGKITNHNDRIKKVGHQNRFGMRWRDANDVSQSSGFDSHGGLSIIPGPHSFSVRVLILMSFC